ncbi:hypothetical protein J2Z21_001237 [Streptomyces griseochromogenes]|uniref:Uncharacterized protein n=1 Tax=Streptomyces griseochromogenes TaxID=68214 RepID=A0ABS4LLP3_9ACTN|nr:hypothetical protein [Streptomyces griseochromogenes]MBP2048313.1 hypothetical protein [Streptomyces griseochromogenes]
MTALRSLCFPGEFRAGTYRRFTAAPDAPSPRVSGARMPLGNGRRTERGAP